MKSYEEEKKKRCDWEVREYRGTERRDDDWDGEYEALNAVEAARMFARDALEDDAKYEGSDFSRTLEVRKWSEKNRKTKILLITVQAEFEIDWHAEVIKK